MITRTARARVAVLEVVRRQTDPERPRPRQITTSAPQGWSSWRGGSYLRAYARTMEAYGYHVATEQPTRARPCVRLEL